MSKREWFGILNFVHWDRFGIWFFFPHKANTKTFYIVSFITTPVENELCYDPGYRFHGIDL